MGTYFEILSSVHVALSLGVGLFIGYHLGYRHCRGELWHEQLIRGWLGPLGQVLRALPIALCILLVTGLGVWLWLWGG